MSWRFQDTLAAHLHAVFGGAVAAYVSDETCHEVLIPACETWLLDCTFQPLPATKAEYMDQGRCC